MTSPGDGSVSRGVTGRLRAAVRHRLHEARSRRAWPLGWVALVTIELLSLVAYQIATGPAVGEVRYLLYPFVWINVGLWAVTTTNPAAGSTRHHRLALLVGGGYFVAVMAIPGNLALGSLRGLHLDFSSLRVAMAPPGWGPIVAYAGVVRLYLVPFEVVGYLALAYLVYANALSLARGTLGGALGLATCVGCTVPVLAPLAGALGGPATGLATTAYAYSYDLGTALFVLTTLVLVASHDRGRG